MLKYSNEISNCLNIMLSKEIIGFYSMFEYYSKEHSSLLGHQASSFNFVMIKPEYRGRGYFIDSLCDLINYVGNHSKFLVVEYPQNQEKWINTALKLKNKNFIDNYFFDEHLILKLKKH